MCIRDSIVSKFSLDRLPWPLPAALVWIAAWAVFITLAESRLGILVALAGACVLGVAASVLGASWWRRLMIALGFPLSLAVSGAASLPAWSWLLSLLLLLLIYPLNAWRDAPLFPTPKNALKELAAHVPLAQHALILDAGCGLGDGLKALRGAYPQAHLHGLESVSYTHLDVYKRQVQHCDSTQCASGRGTQLWFARCGV